MTHKLYNVVRSTFSKEVDLSELLLRFTNPKGTGLIYASKLKRPKMMIAEKKRKEEEEEEESKRKRKKEIDFSNVPFHMLKPKDGRSTRTTKPKSEMTSSSKQKKKQFVDPSVGIKTKRLKMMNAEEKREERKREERKRTKVKESIVSGIPEENVARTTKQKKPRY